MRRLRPSGTLAIVLSLFTLGFVAGHARATVVDVRTHGAKMDGTNDVDALNAAIAAIPASGGTVLIPGVMGLGSKGWKGIYIRGRSDLTIAGSGSGSGIRVLHRPSQTIQSGGGESFAVLRIADGSNITVNGLDFDGNGVQAVFVALDNVSRSRVLGNRFRNTPEDETTPRIAPAVQSNSGKGNVYTGNVFRNVDYGLGLGGWGRGKGDADSVVRENSFVDILNDGLLIGGSGITVTGNVFNGAGRCAVIIGETFGRTGSSRIDVEGNAIRDSRWHGVQADLTLPARLDRIRISENIFDNNLLSGAFLQNMTRSIFRENIVTGGQRGVMGSAVDNLVIEGNRFAGQTVAGIQFTQDNAYFVANLVLSNNFIRTGPRGGHGIYIPAQPAGAGNRNAVIQGNSVTASGYAIWIWNGFRNVRISNNVLSGNTSDLRVDDDAYSTYGDNNVYATTSGNKIGYISDGKRHNFGKGPPRSGTWAVGDRFLRDPIERGKPKGWVCVEGGTPGTWISEEYP
jgi:hypothetical protein